MTNLINQTLGAETEQMVTIPLTEYHRLANAAEWLFYLEAAGVDEWDGCWIASQLKEKDLEVQNKIEPKID